MAPSFHRRSTPFEINPTVELDHHENSSHDLETHEAYGYEPLATSPSVLDTEINNPALDPDSTFARHSRIRTSDFFSPETEFLLLTVPGTDNAEFYYEPLSTQSDIYDTVIVNISDLDPNDPSTLHDFLARIGASQYSSPPPEAEPLLDLDLEEGYGADDEGSLCFLVAESLKVQIVEQAVVYSPRIYAEIGEVGSEDWTLDTDPDRQAIHPAFTRRPTLIGQSSGTSYESDSPSPSPRWMGRTFSTQRRASDSEDERQDFPLLQHRSFLRAFLNRPLRGKIEHFELVAGAEHYPEAAEFFTLDASTGEFTNPFMDPSYPVNQRNPFVEQLSPLMRPTDYGLDENWRFIIPQVQAVSPFSPISNLSQFDDGIPVTLMSERQTNERGERRSSRAFGLSISGAPVIFDSTPSTSSGSYFSDGHSRTFFAFQPFEDRIPFSTSELDWSLNELLFEDAAHEFLSGIDVEGLVADRRSGKYTLEDHDELYLSHDCYEDLEELDCKWPYYHWLPHSVTSLLRNSEDEECPDCPCGECSEARYHDFDRGCSCLECQEILYEAMVEMHRLERRILRADEELVRPGSPKRKYMESEDEELQESQDSKARPQVRRQTQKVKAVQNTEEEEDKLQPADANICTQKSKGEKENPCHSLFKKFLRRPSSP